MDLKQQYDEIVKNSKFNPNDVYSSDENIKFLSRTTEISFNGLESFIKIPHSVSFKHYQKMWLFVDDKLKKSDNFLSTTSELIGQKKYEKFNFLTAKYFPKNLDGKYFVLSPNFLRGNFEFYPLIKALSPISGGNCNTISLEGLLLQKNIFMRFITEQCYDEIISYILISLFDFSDDENSTNVFLCRQKGRAKFENVYIIDKESTYFNFLLASKFSVRDTKFKTDSARLTHYKISESLFDQKQIDKFDSLLNLAKRGLFSESQLNLIAKIADFNYKLVAEEIADEFDIVADSAQIELYEHGSNHARQVLEKI